MYQDPWIQVDRDQVIRPDGAPGTHCIVHLLHGISVLAVDDDGMAHLTQDFHYGVGRTTIEVVSGGVEAGEEPLAPPSANCAKSWASRPASGMTWACAIRSPRSWSRPRACFWRGS